MHIRRFLSCFLVFGAALATSSKAATTEPDTIQLVTNFAVTATTQVPGKMLKAGNYSIRVVDHLSDRVILQIEDAKGSSQTRFLALESTELRKSTRQPGPLVWANGPNRETALRGFTFPGGTTVEFVYPKKDAVLIAKVNSSRVPAIDPESEGKVAAKNLSKDDLQTVTLWTLMAKKVGPEDGTVPAIEAERYSPIRESANDDSSRVGQRVDSAPKLNGTAQVQTKSNTQVALVHKPLLAALPHTASYQPLIALLGLLTLFLGGLIHLLRRTANELPA